MFLILTVLTVWYYLIFGWHAFDHAFSWGNFGWGGVILSPITLTLFLFWLIGTFLGFALIAGRSQARFLFYSSGIRTSSPRGNILKFVDIPLTVGGIALAVYGGLAGRLAPLMLGIMLTFGLLFHFAEQWLRARFI